MRRAFAPLYVGLLPLVAAGSHGCHWGDRHVPPEEIAALPGLSIVEYDGLNLLLKRGSGGAILIVDGRQVERAELRLGDRFVLTDGRDLNETYQLLLVSKDRVTLKRRQTFDRRAQREGVRTVENVVALTPYNLDEIRSPRRANRRR